MEAGKLETSCEMRAKRKRGNERDQNKSRMDQVEDKEWWEVKEEGYTDSSWLLAVSVLATCWHYQFFTSYLSSILSVLSKVLTQNPNVVLVFCRTY